MTFLNNVLKFLKESSIAYGDRFAPYFVYSTACHMFNLANQKREFYWSGGTRPADTRLHVFMVAPPGFTKTIMLRKFIDGRNSIIGCTEGDVECAFEGSMTEAGFVGSIMAGQGGEPVKQYGAAHEHRMAIMGVDEFSALSNAMKMEHSINLDNAMLTALDSGWCLKRLRMGKLHYMTNVTVMTGSQPARFNLASGLGRRFLFEYFIPTREEQDEIKKAMRRGENIRPDRSLLARIREDLRLIDESLTTVKHVKFDNSFYRLMDTIGVPHFEEMLYKRMSIGHYLATHSNGCDNTIEIEETALLREHVIRVNDWRREIKKGAETSQVWLVCKEMDGSLVSDVKTRLTDFGIEYSQSSKLMERLQKQGRIEIVAPLKPGKGRPGKIVVVRY